MVRLWKTYDKSFLCSLGLQYFNNGFGTIVALAYMYRFLNHYHLSPSATSQYTALLSLPWTPKLLYGLFTDTFPLFGSRKRNYLILMGLIQGICLALAFFPSDNPNIFIAFLFITAFSGAVMDVVVDGLMVVQ
jgi:MFS family permease